MNGNFARGRWMLLSTAMMLALNGAGSAAEVNLTRTNWTERVITNVIDIHMPMNVFVNEYHTNWIEQVRTNLVTRYATNLSSRVLTNTVLVNAIHTNLVERYQTNFTTLTLTNWKTVLVMKTNWVTQPMTNVVQIDMGSKQPMAAVAEKPARPAAAAPAAPATPANSEAPLAPAPISNDVSLEAFRTARPVINNTVEVQLRVRWTGAVASALNVQQWRVESEDGTILVQAQEKDFRRDLPLGRYKVDVRVRREANGPLLAARGTLSVTARDAYVLQKVAAN
jgi:hypothetical protein